MATIYGDGFESLEDLKQWDGALEHLSRPGVELIYAAYEQYSYEGSAVAVWRENGKLYEAHCSHCSCNGLDGFDPEETSVEALLMQGRFRDIEPLRAALEHKSDET